MNKQEWLVCTASSGSGTSSISPAISSRPAHRVRGAAGPAARRRRPARPCKTRDAGRPGQARSGEAEGPPGRPGEGGDGKGRFRPDPVGWVEQPERKRTAARPGEMRVHPSGDEAVQRVQRVGGRHIWALKVRGVQIGEAAKTIATRARS
jgi:hypothetical protein